MKVLEVIWAILRGIFRGILDGFPFSDTAGPTSSWESQWWEGKARPQAREDAKGPASPEDNPSTRRATMPGWWAAPAPPTSPPIIKVETDTGTFIAASSFSGPNLMGIRRIERPRQEGESRRRRRRAGAPASPVTRANVELRSREPAVPESTEAREAGCAKVEHEVVETAVAVATMGQTQRSGADVAVPVVPAEAGRVARARRVRGRLGGVDGSSPRLATTLATRLALAASTLSLPAPAAVMEGA